MKRKLDRRVVIVPQAKTWCMNCRAALMKRRDELYLNRIELWECAKCKLIERYSVE